MKKLIDPEADTNLASESIGGVTRNLPVVVRNFVETGSAALQRPVQVATRAPCCEAGCADVVLGSNINDLPPNPIAMLRPMVCSVASTAAMTSEPAQAHPIISLSCADRFRVDNHYRRDSGLARGAMRPSYDALVLQPPLGLIS